MENNVSARPIIAPKAILAGFKMADILEGIAEEFKSIAGTNPLRAEQANKTSRKWENFAYLFRICQKNMQIWFFKHLFVWKIVKS